MSTNTSAATIVACIDGSAHARAASEAAIWAAARLQAPLAFLHVISRRKHPGPERDYSGHIGLGTREHLLQQWAELDGERARLARERGLDMLEAASQHARDAGIVEPTRRLDNGELADIAADMADNARLLTIGRHGESAGDDIDVFGSNLERVLRRLSCPILVTGDTFTPPTRILLAFDGSATAANLVERAAATPLLAGMAVHVVHVGTPSVDYHDQMRAAEARLTDAGATVTVVSITGEVEPALHDYQREQGCDLLVMGAYGHSRIRHLLVGSTTTDMIRRAEVPVLVTR